MVGKPFIEGHAELLTDERNDWVIGKQLALIDDLNDYVNRSILLRFALLSLAKVCTLTLSIWYHMTLVTVLILSLRQTKKCL